MVDRINLILKAKNLTSRQFAEEIGIQPSGMSHILSGRNRPSLDFVMKVVTRYPEIDIKWLTLGEGEMYVSPYSMPVAPSSVGSGQPAQTPQSNQPMQPSQPTQPSQPIQPAQPPQPAATIQSAPPLPSTSQPAEPQPATLNPAPGELDLFSLAEQPNEPDPVQYSIFQEAEPELQGSAPLQPGLSDAEPVVASANEIPAVETNGRRMEVPAQMSKPVENRVDDNGRPMGAEKRNLAKKRIVKVVILYDDHSFSEYYPE